MKYIYGFFVLIIITIGLAITNSNDNNLHIIACDVGQGDAILITHGKDQILIDGGPNDKVLGCLSSHMPFWDREIEVVILTHPQTDHFTGLIQVFRKYRVDNFLANQVDSSTQSYQVLKKEVGGSSTNITNPVVGTKLRLGLIYLDILNPSKELAIRSETSKLGVFETDRDLNDFSIVTLLSFKNFKGIFTGDLGPPTIDGISYVNTGRINYLKVPHHGSRNGMTQNFLDLVNPEIAVISAGKANRYGHPHSEITQMLKEKLVKILRTDEIGDIEIVSDGNSWWAK